MCRGMNSHLEIARLVHTMQFLVLTPISMFNPNQWLWPGGLGSKTQGVENHEAIKDIL